jgi:hypothetical protein
VTQSLKGNRLRTAFFALVCAAAFAGQSRADTVLYSTDGTATPSWNNNFYYERVDNVYPVGEEIAYRFQLAQSGTLSEVSAPVASWLAPQPMYFDIYSDAGGSFPEPGTLLDSISATATSSSAGIFSGTSSVNPVLTAGNFYWMSIRLPTDAQAAVAWLDAASGFQTTAEYYYGNVADTGGYTTRAIGAFALLGDSSGDQAAAPEPSTLWLLTPPALAGLLLRRRNPVS